MNSLPRQTLGLLLLRSGPQDLPARNDCLVAAGLCFAVVTVLNPVALESGIVPAAFSACLSVAMLAVFTAVVLRIGGRPKRFQQSFMALLLTAAAIGFLELGPTAVLKPYLAQVVRLAGPNPTADALRDALMQVQIPGALVVVLCALFVWRMLVMGHVLRHALEIRLAHAVALALLYPIVVLLLVSLSRPA